MLINRVKINVFNHLLVKIILLACLPDMAKLNKFCRENKLNDSVTLSVNSIPVSHTILVQNINPGTSTEFIKFFFMNKIKNKGGPIKNVQRLNETTALVFFQNPKGGVFSVVKCSYSSKIRTMLNVHY